MSGKRNLRNRIIELEKSSGLLKEKTCLSKSKLHNKENSNVKKHSNFDNKKTSKTHKSTLKECLLKNNIDEKENKNICNNVSVVPHIRKSKRAVVKQNPSSKRKLCPLKESNFSEDVVKKISPPQKKIVCPLKESNSSEDVVKKNSPPQKKLVCPLKESNFSEDTVHCTEYIKKKTKVNLSVRKQSVKKISASEQRDIKSKKFKGITKKIVSKTKIVKSKTENKKSDNEKKIKAKIGLIKTELSAIKSSTNFPVWKKNINVFNQRKRRRNVDVYDINLDEDLLSNKEEIEKKIHSKKKPNSRISKKGPLSSKTESSRRKILSCNSKPPGKRPILKTGRIMASQKLAVIEPVKRVAAETLSLDQNRNDDTCVLASKTNLQTSLSNSGVYDDLIKAIQPTDLVTTKTLSLNKNRNDTCVLVPEINLQTLLSNSDVYDDLIETIQPTDIEIQSSESRAYKNRYVSKLVDELEKSFLIPRMTSTPDAIHPKPGIHTQKSRAVKVIDISNIPPYNINLNTTVTTPSSPSNNVPIDVEENGDITLFESPQKQEKRQRNGNALVSPKKTIQINLFGEMLRSPSSERNLDNSVLIPQKAYHTPDNFKNHLVRTKQTAQNIRKEPKKSKQDLLIEKMSQHFDDIGHTELCIE